MTVQEFPASHFTNNDLSQQIVDAAFHVHKLLGPGLLESVYEECLCITLAKRGIPFERQKAMPVFFEDQKIEVGFRLDLVIGNQIIVELKAVEKIMPVHEAQILSYLKLSQIKAGFLINYNTKMFKDGIKRYVL